MPQPPYGAVPLKGGRPHPPRAWGTIGPPESATEFVSTLFHTVERKRGKRWPRGASAVRWPVCNTRLLLLLRARVPSGVREPGATIVDITRLHKARTGSAQESRLSSSLRLWNEGLRVPCR